MGDAAELRLGEFEAQGLANMSWAFATVGQPVPVVLNPISVLDTIEAQHTQPEGMYYNMLMQCVAITGQVAEGFTLLERAQANGLQTKFAGHCYAMCRTLLETCRVVGDVEGASRVQAAVDRLGLIALAPAATMLVQGSERVYENGVSGEGVDDVEELWKQVRQLTRYTPQVQALPWAFVRKSTVVQQQNSLQLHAEKKALTVLLACAADELIVSIGFNACTDCHDALKNAALLLGRRIYLRQPKMVHAFADGSCSCNDRWRWEARISLSQA
eukprot:gnl/TRDRNA2_/TRDRNA2_174592_c9_seq16.p1 gnl/TRDRNA2_/TRDRNA2_174592_c9~~gnl/TRDRNA2_/TRDRNA2_174592_c9_seq16.p1  ORF type:complete len:272 (+),score=53.05 gnl/TRDRNA2_/TRDRNA2_174592_c9_seq16:200-1015(+)